MEGKIIKQGNKSQEKIIEGIIDIVSAVSPTLGPAGKFTAVSSNNGMNLDISRDGAGILKSITFRDQEKQMGALLVRKAAIGTEEQAGDATSSTAILTKEMVLKGQKAVQTGSTNVNEIKSGMEKAERWIQDYIKREAIPVDDDYEKIKRVATISANNDPNIGEIVMESYQKVGINGTITADLSSTLETTVQVVDGTKIDKGMSSLQFINSPGEGKCVMEDCFVLVCGEKLSSINQILPIVEQVIKTGKPILFVVDSADDVVVSTLALNSMNGVLRACLIQRIAFGDESDVSLQDIAVLTGASYITPKNGGSIVNATLNDLGTVGKVVISRDNTIIYSGGGNQDEIQERIGIYKQKLQDPDISNYDKTKAEKHVAMMSGGVAVIRAGGSSDVEKRSLKQTIEDSILAAKSAIEEGILLGGGYTYYKMATELGKDKAFWKSLVGNERDGAEIVMNSLPVIIKTIAENTGTSGDIVLEAIGKSKAGVGFNAKTKKYCNLLEEGILDSAKAIRVAIENAISAASMVLLIDCVVIDDPEPEKDK